MVAPSVETALSGAEGVGAGWSTTRTPPSPRRTPLNRHTTTDSGNQLIYSIVGQASHIRASSMVDETTNPLNPRISCSF
ncbi:MAG: hypothetical protein AAF702_25235 [Chloroflexota bacterium]